MTRSSTALAALFLALAAASAGAQEPWPECARSGLGCGVATHSTSSPAWVVPSRQVGYEPIVAVRAGTVVALELGGDLAAKPRVGERIRLEVAVPVHGQTIGVVESPGGIELGETLRPSGIVLVPRGSPAFAEIVAVRSGAPSLITVRPLFVRAGGHDIRLRGQARLEARPGAAVEAMLDEDVVPAQALRPRRVPDVSRARIATAAELRAAPASPPPPPAPTIAEPPRPRLDPDSLIMPADYPESALHAREEGLVVYILDVGANGRVTGCTIRRSSGSSALDSTTCRLMRSRARFTPARDTTGNPAASKVLQEMNWRLPASR